VQGAAQKAGTGYAARKKNNRNQKQKKEAVLT
jgi:hypothetical protein